MNQDTVVAFYVPYDTMFREALLNGNAADTLLDIGVTEEQAGAVLELCKELVEINSDVIAMAIKGEKE